MASRKAAHVGKCALCFSKIDTRTVDTTTDISQRSVRRTCCNVSICPGCMNTYLDTKVREGVAFIQCPGVGCDSRIKDYEILSRLTNGEVQRKFIKFLVDALKDPTRKTCPRCGVELRVKEAADLNNSEQPSAERSPRGYPVTCQACALKWCFTCHAPWHEDLTCHDYVTRRDRPFTAWAHIRSGTGAGMNAQTCPCCQTYIQRSYGCDKMTCPLCLADFCYLCGSTLTRTRNPRGHLSTFFLGDHHKRWTPLGCPRSLWPKAPLLRRAVKGLILGVKVLGIIPLPLLVTLLALLVLLIYFGVIIPVYFGLKMLRKAHDNLTAAGVKALSIIPLPLLLVVVAVLGLLVYVGVIIPVRIVHDNFTATDRRRAIQLAAALYRRFRQRGFRGGGVCLLAFLISMQ